MSEPRLTIGLPVYNGEPFLRQALDALVGQTYADFELVISDNASTDASPAICAEYARRDPRIRIVQQRQNIGAVPNHYAVLAEARGELFTWASADDLYGREFLARCVDLLDRSPVAILAHSWTAAIDENSTIIQALEYPLRTAAERPSDRLRSMLFDHDSIRGAIAADDFYGVFRTDALRAAPRHGTYYHADQTLMIALALRGKFVHCPEWLYFRRHHAARAKVAHTSVGAWTANLDPTRRGHSTPRLVAAFGWGQFTTIGAAPLSVPERARCYAHLARWASARARARLPLIGGPSEDLAAPGPSSLHVSDMTPVAGQ